MMHASVISKCDEILKKKSYGTCDSRRRRRRRWRRTRKEKERRETVPECCDENKTHAFLRLMTVHLVLLRGEGWELPGVSQAEP